MNIRCSLRESRLSLICSLHGCSSPTALQPRPLTFCACSHQLWCAGLRKITTTVCGAASVSCWVSLPTRATWFGPVPQLPLSLEGWVSEAQCGHLSPHIGPVGADCLPMMREKASRSCQGACDEIGGWSRNPIFGRCRDSCPQPGWHPRVRTTLMDCTGTWGSSSSQRAR